MQIYVAFSVEKRLNCVIVLQSSTSNNLYNNFLPGKWHKMYNVYTWCVLNCQLFELIKCNSFFLIEIFIENQLLANHDEDALTFSELQLSDLLTFYGTQVLYNFNSIHPPILFIHEPRNKRMFHHIILFFVQKLTLIKYNSEFNYRL